MSLSVESLTDEWPQNGKKYQRKAKLSESIYFQVYIAHCITNKEDVIVKRWNCSIIDEKHEYLDSNMLMKSLQILDNINKNNRFLITPITIFIQERYIYGIYKLFNGGNLSDMLNMHYSNTGINDDKNEMKIARIIRDLLNGLKYLHNNGYAHRMINPDGIFLDKSNGIALLSKMEYLLAIHDVDKSSKRKRKNSFGVSFKKNRNNNISGIHESTQFFVQKYLRKCGYDDKYQQYTNPELLKYFKNNNSDIGNRIWFNNDIYSIGVLCLEMRFGLLPKIKLTKEKFNEDIRIHDRIKIKHCWRNGYNNKLSKNFIEFIQACITNKNKSMTVDKLLQHKFLKHKRVLSHQNSALWYTSFMPNHVRFKSSDHIDTSGELKLDDLRSMVVKGLIQDISSDFEFNNSNKLVVRSKINNNNNNINNSSSSGDSNDDAKSIVSQWDLDTSKVNKLYVVLMWAILIYLET